VGAVLGVDGCRGGWVGVLWADDCAVHVLGTIELADLVQQARELDELSAIAIDMPIDLPESAPRESDALARRRLGARSSSVFTTPMRAALHATTHAEANAANRAASGKGLSIQAFHLLPRIREVEMWLADGAGVPLIEAHPESSFVALAGGPLIHSKRTVQGASERRLLLRSVGAEPPTERLGVRAGVDDVLDAAAAAWTARRFVTGTAERLPAEPRGDLSPAIWI